MGNSTKIIAPEPEGMVDGETGDIVYLSRSSQQRNLTPGITRRPASLLEHESARVGGRVHAVVRLRRSRDATGISI